MKVTNSIILLLILAGCEAGNSDTTYDQSTNSNQAIETVSTGNVSPDTVIPTHSSLDGVVNQVIGNLNSSSRELGQDSNLLLNDGQNFIAGNYTGIWDITGNWDSVDGDIAYLEINDFSISSPGTIVLYDFDGDSAGEGRDCFLTPVSGAIKADSETGYASIDGPYPLNGILSVNQNDSTMTIYMLDLLDSDNDDIYDEVIEYTAIKVETNTFIKSTVCD